MRTLRIPAALAVIACLVAGTAWALGWPIERAVYLAPVIVVGFVLLWFAIGAFAAGSVMFFDFKLASAPIE